MTAKYKRRRHLTENSIDWKPYNFKFEGAERQEAKREIAEEVNELENKETITQELAYEQEMKMASECYAREQTDPNYKCMCFEVDEDD